MSDASLKAEIDSKPKVQSTSSKYKVQRTKSNANCKNKMIEYVSSTVEHIRRELSKIVVGQDEPIEQILVALLAEGHALIEGVPGTAKTLTVKTLARIINANFGRIQFTPDLMPSDITGTNVFNVATSTFNLRQGPIFTDILLADEINRTPPKTQAALLEAMEERQVTIDGDGHALSPIFTVLATENPIEYEGTYPLPEAQLDRFMLKILLDYPGEEHERQVVANWDAGFNSRRLERRRHRAAGRRGRDFSLPSRGEHRAHGAGRAALRSRSGAAHAHRILSFTTARVRALQWRCCCARKRWRQFAVASFQRLTTCATSPRPVLRHRLTLRAEAELDGATPDAVITDILKSAEVPR